MSIRMNLVLKAPAQKPAQFASMKAKGIPVVSTAIPAIQTRATTALPPPALLTLANGEYARVATSRGRRFVRRCVRRLGNLPS